MYMYIYAYHDRQRCDIHYDAEDDTENTDDHGPPIGGMEEVDDEGTKGDDEGDLGGDDEDDPELELGRGEDDKGDNVAQLYDNPRTVDGEDQGAVRVHNGQAIQHPHQAIEQGGKVRKWGELLHISLLHYGHKCWPIYIYIYTIIYHHEKNRIIRKELSQSIAILVKTHTCSII